MKKVSLLLQLFVCMLLIVLFTVPLNAATLEVGEGKPYSSIQTAINVAVTGDIVLVHDGTYVEQINFMGKAITVRSVNGAASTIIDGNASGTVVTFNNGEGSGSVLDGFTITNANGYYGGGISCFSSSPSIANCTIMGNTSSAYGGGIYCRESSPSITNSIISGNTAGASGGGMHCFLSSSPSISNTTIEGNTAVETGGGIYCASSSSPNISNSIITGNTVSAYGGGIYCASSSSPSISNTTIEGNTAGPYGGGIVAVYSSPNISNSIISGNTVNYQAGGIFCSDSYLSITNSTISGNTAGSSGGGIVCYHFSSPSVNNSILWGNFASTEKEIYLNSSTISVMYSDVDQDGYSGSNGNIRQDPLFFDQANGNFYLQPESPCIDAGTSDGAPSSDMEGFARYDDLLVPNMGGGALGYYDMGALEYANVNYNLIVTQEGTGSGSISARDLSCAGSECTGIYSRGASVTISASADTDSGFSGWSGCNAEDGNTCTVHMTSGKSVTATFTLIHVLTIEKTGSGTVTGSGINCGTECTRTYDHGTVMSLSAAPESGFVFDGWSGGGCSGTGSCEITMNADTTVTATFTSLIWPNEGTIGTQVIITGSGFGARKGRVLINGIPTKIAKGDWGEDQITCTIVKPPLPVDVAHPVSVVVNRVPIPVDGAFTLKGLVLDELLTSSGAYPNPIEVTGKFFGTRKGKVYLYNPTTDKRKKLKVTEWKMNESTGASELKFVVPKPSKAFPAGVYQLNVVNKIGPASTSPEFELLEPAL